MNWPRQRGDLLPPRTWANRPAASSVAKGTAIQPITDYGVGTSYWYSDGTYWRPVGGSMLLASSTVPIGFAPAFTSSSNGVITLTNGFTPTYGPGGGIPGIWLYFGANTVTSGNAAGFYWTVMTSSTAGTVYNNTYTPGFPDSTTVPASPTPFVSSAGSGAGTAATEVTMLAATVKAGSLGNSGRLEAFAVTDGVNAAGSNKTIFCRLNSSGYTVSNSITTPVAGNVYSGFQNWAATGQQIAVGGQYYVNGWGSQISSNWSRIATDTTIDVTFKFTSSLVAATDSMILTNVQLWLRN